MIQVHAMDEWRIVVPLRLRRVVTGLPVADAPDIDDRGWVMPRPTGFSATDARGPMFGITVGSTVRVRVVLEDMDGSAVIYAVAEAVARPQFEVVGNGLVPPDGEIRVRATSSTGDPQRLQFRLGAADGPVIFEAEPHVFGVKTLRVTPHLCTIHSAANPGPGTGVVPSIGGAALDLARVFRIAQNIWNAAGVRLDVAATVNETYWGFARDDMPRWQNPPGAGSENSVVNQNRAANRLNIYFTRYMENSMGVGVNRSRLAAEGWTNPSIILAVEGQVNTGGGLNSAATARASTDDDMYHTLGNDVAHEIGHYLTLSHAGNVDAPGRRDTYARRQLMFPNNPFGSGSEDIAVPRFSNIGYGDNLRGALLTLKRFSTYANDGEAGRARSAFNAANLY